MKPFNYLQLVPPSKRFHLLHMLLIATFSFAQQGIGTHQPNPNATKLPLMPMLLSTTSINFMIEPKAGK